MWSAVSFPALPQYDAIPLCLRCFCMAVGSTSKFSKKHATPLQDRPTRCEVQQCADFGRVFEPSAFEFRVHRSWTTIGRPHLRSVQLPVELCERHRFRVCGLSPNCSARCKISDRTDSGRLGQSSISRAKSTRICSAGAALQTKSVVFAWASCEVSNQYRPGSFDSVARDTSRAASNNLSRRRFNQRYNGPLQWLGERYPSCNDFCQVVVN